MFIILSQTQDVCESGLGNNRQEKQSYLHHNQKETIKSGVKSRAQALMIHIIIFVEMVDGENSKRFN